MKIALINPGLLPIPPNNWGAVEKIIWQQKIELEKLGHIVDIKYINEIENNEYSIVHVNMWNQALDLHSKNIPYIFTFHDHHAYAYGKTSIVYKNNLLAMKYAKLAIVPAKYLIPYFENIPVYLNHGVDVTKYQSDSNSHNDFKLLCVGNNGFGGDSSFDRKGFSYAIDAAKQLNLPITVVGPSMYNSEFFGSHPELLGDLVTVKYDLTDQELIKVYQSHDLLIHATNVEAGHPPLTILEAAACGLPVLTTKCSGELYTILIERDVDSIKSAILNTKKLYALNKSKTLESVQNFDWSIVCKNLEYFYNSSFKNDMKSSILKLYNKVEKKLVENTININFADGPFFEMAGPIEKDFKIQFIDLNSKEIVYESRLKNNQWAKCNRKWYTNWLIRIEDSSGKIMEYTFNPTNKRVYISFDSSSIGDTIAWLPFVEEFRKKHNCILIASTFWNSMFKDQYPNIEFVEPNDQITNLYAVYRIGLFYNESNFDDSRHKTNFLQLSLQQVVTDILGLDFTEIRPEIKRPIKYKSKTPYICIANHSTAQSKYWNNPTGWQELVDYVKSLGYEVYLLSKEPDGYMGNKNPTGVTVIKDKSLEEIGSILLGCEVFVGLSSGLSWYAWALQVPTILISGFTKSDFEMMNGVDHIHNTSVCNGCFSRHYFDKGDWNWCPDNKNTEKQFECSKTITFEMVKPYLQKYL